MPELGERVANLEARFDAIGQDTAEIRDNVRRLDDRMEARFQAMDEKMESRFLAVDGRFDRLESRMTDGFRELRSDMHTNFRWVMGGMGGALLATLLAIIGAVFAIRP